MTFDTSVKPHRDGLSPAIAAMMVRLFYARRAAGLNVQFRTKKGVIDERSFKDRTRAEAFAASLSRQGIPSALSAAN